MTSGPISGVPDPGEQKTYYFKITPIRQAVTLTLKGLFYFFGVIQVRGVKHLAASGPVILAANHLTNFDVFPLQFALPRPIFYMGKEELFRNPVMDYMLRQLGGFPVYRGSQDARRIHRNRA